MITTTGPVAVDARAAGWLPEAEPGVCAAWEAVQAVAGAELAPMGLAAGDRPLADVEVLAGALGACEFALAVRLHAAGAAGALPLPGPGGVLPARGWSSAAARRLARCGDLVARCPAFGVPWAAGVITSEHLDPIARLAERFSEVELAAVADGLAGNWGSWPPGLIGRFVAAAERMLHPPGDPMPDEVAAHAARSLSFSVTGDSVIVGGQLPRVEGELVMAAIDAIAERLRSEADHVPGAARRADALVQLVNDAHGADLLPSRGGLPVGLTVTVDRTEVGDPVWRTSRGHLLTPAEVRWACCDAAITPVLLEGPTSDAVQSGAAGHQGCPVSAAARVAALATVMLEPRLPLAVGRTQRSASAGQRRALAVRDGGCVIPGCGVPAEACQVHHLVEWADGGATDLDNCVLLCWAHHRQVDLRMWRIEPGRPAPPGQGAGPAPGAPPGVPWPANRAAPFTVTRTPRRDRGVNWSAGPGVQ